MHIFHIKIHPMNNNIIEEEFNQTFYRTQTSKIDIPQLYGLGFRG